MKHFALYCRVSMTDGTQTTENQKARLVDFAKNNGYSFDIVEECESSRKTRPRKQDILQKARQGVYQGIAVYRLDRWGRSLSELTMNLTELINKGIDFVSITENLDFTSSAGKLHFHILCAFSEFERELIRERTICALQRKKEEGYRFSGRPRGAKDLRKRKTEGYYLREAKKREQTLSKIGVSTNN